MSIIEDAATRLAPDDPLSSRTQALGVFVLKAATLHRFPFGRVGHTVMSVLFMQFGVKLISDALPALG